MLILEVRMDGLVDVLGAFVKPNNQPIGYALRATLINPWASFYTHAQNNVEIVKLKSSKHILLWVTQIGYALSVYLLRRNTLNHLEVHES